MKIIYKSQLNFESNPKIDNIIESLRKLNPASARNLDESCLFNPEYSIINISDINKLSKSFQKSKLVIIIGIGGSILGLKAFLQIYTAENSRIIILDSASGNNLEELNIRINQLKEIDDCCLIVISKSGSTLETSFNFLQTIDLLQKKFKRAKLKKIYSRIIAITTQDSKLAQHVLKNSGKVVYHSKFLSGRFSIFSEVGVLPLLIIKALDVQRLLNGAIQARNDILSIPSPTLNQIISDKVRLASRNICINDYFIFDTRLEGLGKWLRQLIAESLGKDKLGLFPTISIGSADLHSMFQYYLGGNFPNFTEFILIKPNNQFDKLNFLAGKSTIDAFEKHHKVQLQITFDKLNEFELGYFMQYKMIETIIIGKLFELNVFDQPMVEQYKKYLKKYLR